MNKNRNPFDLTDAELAQAKANVGGHLIEGCGACAEIFFTGVTIHAHKHTVTIGSRRLTNT
jgi:hypothetical protein